MRARYGWLVFIILLLVSMFLIWVLRPAAIQQKQPANERYSEQKIRDITLESVYPGYRLEKTDDFAAFEDYLETRRFWEDEAIVDQGGAQTAQSLRIVLTNTPQNGDRQMAGKTVEELQEVSSAFVTIDNGVVTFTVYVNPAVALEN